MQTAGKKYQNLPLAALLLAGAAFIASCGNPSNGDPSGAKTLTITGITGYEGVWPEVGIYSDKGLTKVAHDLGTPVVNGSVKIYLEEHGTDSFVPWTGSGPHYISLFLNGHNSPFSEGRYYGYTNGKTVYASRADLEPYNFSQADSVVPFSKFGKDVPKTMTITGIPGEFNDAFGEILLYTTFMNRLGFVRDLHRERFQHCAERELSYPAFGRYGGILLLYQQPGILRGIFERPRALY